MDKVKYYQLTFYKHDNFAAEIAKQINKDFPNVAFVAENQTGSACFITAKYWQWCKEYVYKHCNIKG